jgi:hypothetical protein
MDVGRPAIPRAEVTPEREAVAAPEAIKVALQETGSMRRHTGGKGWTCGGMAGSNRAWGGAEAGGVSPLRIDHAAGGEARVAADAVTRGAAVAHGGANSDK